MKFLFASDSFKGTLTSGQTVELLARAARDVFGDIEYSGVTSVIPATASCPTT